MYPLLESGLAGVFEWLASHDTTISHHPAKPTLTRLTFGLPSCDPQPKQIHEIKDFLLTARRKDAKCTLARTASELIVAPRDRFSCLESEQFLV